MRLFALARLLMRRVSLYAEARFVVGQIQKALYTKKIDKLNQIRRQQGLSEVPSTVPAADKATLNRPSSPQNLDQESAPDRP